ncbi:unnamed protein product, partial [Protopolystoma xenopodis]
RAKEPQIGWLRTKGTRNVTSTFQQGIATNASKNLADNASVVTDISLDVGAVVSVIKLFFGDRRLSISAFKGGVSGEHGQDKESRDTRLMMSPLGMSPLPAVAANCRMGSHGFLAICANLASDSTCLTQNWTLCVCAIIAINL